MYYTFFFERCQYSLSTKIVTCELICLKRKSNNLRRRKAQKVFANFEAVAIKKSFRSWSQLLPASSSCVYRHESDCVPKWFFAQTVSASSGRQRGTKSVRVCLSALLVSVNAWFAKSFVREKVRSGLVKVLGNDGIG